MPDPAEFLRLVERSIEVEWLHGAVTPVAKPHTTGWRILPFLVTAQLRDGCSCIELEDGVHELRDGQALCIRAGIRHCITLQTTAPGSSLWSHVHVRLFGSIDLMTLLALPMVLSGAAAQRLGEINRELAEAHGRSEPGVPDLISRRHLAFGLLAVLASVAQATPQALLTIQELQRLAPVLEFIEQNLGAEPLDLTQLARRARLSPSRFSAVFRRTLGISPARHVQERRMMRAESLLLGGEMQVQRIAELVGFGDPFHFSRTFTRRHGLSPRSYREQARTALSL